MIQMMCRAILIMLSIVLPLALGSCTALFGIQPITLKESDRKELRRICVVADWCLRRPANSMFAPCSMDPQALYELLENSIQPHEIMRRALLRAFEAESPQLVVDQLADSLWSARSNFNDEVQHLLGVVQGYDALLVLQVEAEAACIGAGGYERVRLHNYAELWRIVDKKKIYIGKHGTSIRNLIQAPSYGSAYEETAPALAENFYEDLHGHEPGQPSP